MFRGEVVVGEVSGSATLAWQRLFGLEVVKGNGEERYKGRNSMGEGRDLYLSGTQYVPGSCPMPSSQ